MDSPGEVTYGADAKKDYELGEEARQSGRYLDALKYFEHIRNKYPYSSQAPLSELAIADTDFDREKYLEAIEGYRSFVKMHPHHEKADYAQFRAALSFYKDIPSNFVLFPSSAERDQSSVREARTALEEFLRLYPGSTWAPEAKKLLVDVRERLASHEMAIADYYLFHERWQAAVGRLNKLVEELPGTSLEPDALLKLARTQIELKEKQKAREALQRLLRDFPQDSRRGEAERLLKGLG
jgi:outer membrane protein assembly factor BamD